MKRVLLSALLVCSIAFSGFVGLDLRQSFSYEIFSSPYYKTLKKNLPAANAKIGYVAVTLDSRARQNPTFTDARMPQLQQAINKFLSDSLQMPAVQMPVYNELYNAKYFPDLFLGSVLGPQKPMYVLADCPQEKEFPEYCVRLAGQMGSKAWMQQLKNLMATQKLDYVIVYQLGEGYLYPNGKTKKVNALVETRKSPPAGLDMGTDFWLPMSQKLVATNKPIDVLFLKGLLIDKEGKAIRYGAEGITAASKAGFLEQTVNIAHEFSEAELNAIENDLRRTDLPAQPLNWQVAAQNLTRMLTSSNAGLQ
ncbi:hypothetical protein [Adhaeribacter terreus]|uniref:Uncharacterized protein n=1 Tax=Adhaeribacter terreus TaxID=529703 RepID=A0ABW0E945_9BACT